MLSNNNKTISIPIMSLSLWILGEIMNDNRAEYQFVPEEIMCFFSALF